MTRAATAHRVGPRCQACGGAERLEVHHLTYERLGYERLTDLMVLCHACHAEAHGQIPALGGPVTGLTVEDHVRRGMSPELLCCQPRAALSLLLGADTQVCEYRAHATAP